MKFKGNIFPKEKLIKMGMNFEVFESKGVVRFKNGAFMENVIKIMDYGYQVSKDDKYVFVFQIENNDDVESYTAIETSILHDQNEEIEELKKLRKKRYEKNK